MYACITDEYCNFYMAWYITVYCVQNQLIYKLLIGNHSVLFEIFIFTDFLYHCTA